MLTNEWQKAKQSNPSGNCVEVRLVSRTSTIQVRDSKNPDADTLTFTRSEWNAFVDGAKAGEFDQ